LVILTVTPGTAAPDESLTAPEMRPVMVCAIAPPLKPIQTTARSSAAKGVILLFIAFLRCWAGCCGVVDERRKAGFHNPTTLRVKEPIIPAKPDNLD
jgi:hypothetical protein